jgi:hypothetical protein
MEKIVWEEIPEELGMSRAWTGAGWLVRCFDDVGQDRGGGMQEGWEWRTSLVFVPDPSKTWLSVGEDV